MSITLELSPEAQARLEAEAARRHQSVDELVTQIAAGLSGQDSLDAFIGCGDSGDASWASRDIHILRHELAERRTSESA